MPSIRATEGQGPSTVAALVIGVIVAACSAPSGSSLSPSIASSAPVQATVILTEDGCDYDGPQQVAVGPVMIDLVNTTSGQFDLDLWRLNDGHTYDELVAHVAEELRRLEAGEPPLGHPTFAELVGEATAEESAEGELRMTLEPGTYGMACILFPAPEVLGAMFTAGPLVVP